MKLLIIIFATSMTLLTGCTYYQPAPSVYTVPNVNKFDQSWSAAVGAMYDQGVRVSYQDRSTGIVRGTLNGIEVTGNVRTQADGSVRVEFNTSGDISRDPTLIQRVTAAYNSRMGR